MSDQERAMILRVRRSETLPWPPRRRICGWDILYVVMYWLMGSVFAIVVQYVSCSGDFGTESLYIRVED